MHLNDLYGKITELSEGCWALPRSSQEIDELIDVLSKPLSAIQAKHVLSSKYASDDLWDFLDELIAAGEGNDDVRASVIHCIRRELSQSKPTKVIQLLQQKLKAINQYEAVKEANEVETQTDNRLALEPAMIAGSRKPNLEYNEKKVKGVLDRVTVELAGKNSEITTKLAKKYKEIDNLEKQLSALRETFNLDAKQHILQYFNAEDEVLTRVVNTASLTLTLSKRVVKSEEVVDFEGFYKQLLVLLPEIEDKLKILKSTYTKIEKKETSPKLTVKIPDTNESINEAIGDFWSKVTSFGNQLLKVFTAWGSQYDSKLDALKDQASKFLVGESLEMTEADENLGVYFKKNKRNGKIIAEPFRNANKSFLSRNNTRTAGGAYEMHDFLAPLTDEDKVKLIKIWNDDSRRQNGLWAYALNDADLLNEVVGEEEEEEDLHKDPDYFDLQYEAKEAKESAFESYQKLLGLSNMAGAEFRDYGLATRFRELSYDAEKVSDQLGVILFDLEEKVKAKKSQPVKEDLEDSHESMLALAKKIRAYSHSPNKDINKEDHLSMMLFYKKRPIKNLSLFALLDALQSMSAEQYNGTKNYVLGDLNV